MACDKMFHAALLCCAVILLVSCSTTLLLEKQALEELSLGPSENSETVFFTRHFTWAGTKSLEVKEHRVVRVGSHRAAAPEVLTVYDGLATRLNHFEARLLRPDGSTELYGLSDLATSTLSSQSVIADWNIRYVPLKRYVPPGTLIETVSNHEMVLAALGASFALSDVGVRGQRINCVLTVPRGQTLLYQVFNDTVAPVIDTSAAGISYAFRWKTYEKDSKTWPFKKTNTLPEVLASLAGSSAEPADNQESAWISFGNRYLDLVESKLRESNKLKALAEEITRGKSGDLEKINAIFEYCQKNIRYEQVYLAFGEIIPNDADLILERKYGDCKDYSLVIYLLARSIGLEPRLALCYRGRGVEVYPQIPVSQFNHMVVQFEHQGADHWFDGTNRTGIPGITTIDLLNARALVLERDSSRFITIQESPLNRLGISGTLVPSGSSLKGRLNVTLAAQYAIDFYTLDLYLNRAKMIESIVQWSRRHLHPDIEIKAVDWKRGDDQFQIVTDLTIPNCLTAVDSTRFTSPSRMFPSLFPEENPADRPDDVYFFPLYGKVDISVDVLRLKESSKGQSPLVSFSFRLPPGPFSEDTRPNFLRLYKAAFSEFTKTLHFIQE
ncbi:MAG: transglutaminase-like domain-containing protein [Bacteroidota bacterium]